MMIFRLWYALFLMHGTALLSQGLRKSKRSFPSRPKRLVTSMNNTCSTHRLLQEHLPVGAILKNGSNLTGNFSFFVGEKAEFLCKAGYREVGKLHSFICQEDSSWKMSSKQQTGLCVIKQCKLDTFSCKDGKTKIDACQQCDCIAHCSDLSDEAFCAPTIVDVTGKAKGTLMPSTPHRNPNKPNTTCSSWRLETDDQDFHIKLLFERFSLFPNCKRNFVALQNVDFVDPTGTAQCCGESRNTGRVCKFGGKTPPPLSLSRTNHMTVLFFSDTGYSSFTASWFNVHRSRAISSEDATHAVTIKLRTTEKDKLVPESDSFTLALILFILLLFALSCFVGCKLGKRYLGPACSFRYLVACILCRPIPAYFHASALSDDLERRSLTEEVHLTTFD